MYCSMMVVFYSVENILTDFGVEHVVGGCLTLLEKLSNFFGRLIIVLHGVPPPTKQKRATVRESEREAKDIIRQMMQPTAIISSDFQIFNT